MISYEENGLIKASDLIEKDCIAYLKEQVDNYDSMNDNVTISTIKFGNNIRYEFDFPATIFFDFKSRNVRLKYDVSNVRPEDPFIIRDCSYAGDKFDVKYIPEKLIFEYYYSLFTFTFQANDIKAYNDCCICLEYMKSRCDTKCNLEKQKEHDNIYVISEPLTDVTKDEQSETVPNILANNSSSVQIINSKTKADLLKGIQDKSAKILRCPSCGKIIANKNEYCPKCFERFDNMVFRPEHYLNPIKEECFYGLYNIDKEERDYKKFVYIDSLSGIVFSPKTNEEYIPDYFSDSFTIKNERIVIGDSVNILKSGNYIYEDSYYEGNIPDRNFFEAYFSKGKWFRPIWFLSNGSMMSFDGIHHDSKVFDEGRYIRDGELIRCDRVEINSKEKWTNYWLVVQGKLCESAWVSEPGMDKITDMNKRTMVGADKYGAPISKEDFFDNYPCPICNARKIWGEMDWKYTAFGTISVSGRCKKCNNFFVENEDQETIKKIAYKGSNPNPYYKAPAGAKRYLDNPCPYCGAFQVRYTKWDDKAMSTAFWGVFSRKLHTTYKCESCGEMWE